ncbi:UNVERIFIED_CONTAM: hypothetical protein H355_005407 [Colinus virginianus]|nr:hypothetical protein H355_005407 [Colinus virginianus]
MRGTRTSTSLMTHDIEKAYYKNPYEEYVLTHWSEPTHVWTEDAANAPRKEDYSRRGGTLVIEQGKTLEDARGDVNRGIEAVEECAAASALLLGDTMSEVADGIDCVTYKFPLGVCAGIAPFNFPVMIPLWMFPLACLVGNTFVMKPSERTPLATMKMMSCIVEANWPKGVINVVVLLNLFLLNNDRERSVQTVCASREAGAMQHGREEPRRRYARRPTQCRTSKGVAFSVNGFFPGCRRRLSSSFKLLQAAQGPAFFFVACFLIDADKERALAGVVKAAFQVAGQRCMAPSVVLLVAEAGRWMDDLLLCASSMRDHESPGLLYFDVQEQSFESEYPNDTRCSNIPHFS